MTNRNEYMRSYYATTDYATKKKVWSRRYYKSERGKQKAKDNALKRLYGITLDDFNRMVKAQDGKCAICNKVPKRLVVDHCHVRSFARKLVCDLCNRAIAVLEDKELVDRIIRYLGEFK